MIHHVVFFNMKPEAEGRSGSENASILVERLHALVGVVPGLVSMSAGTDFSGSPVSWDLALHSTFADRTALEVYRVHPVHQDVVQLVKATTADRAVVDFETSD